MNAAEQTPDVCVVCGRVDTKGNEVSEVDYGRYKGQPMCDSCWERYDDFEADR